MILKEMKKSPRYPFYIFMLLLSLEPFHLM